MAPWVKRVFIDILPRFLCMQRPDNDTNSDTDTKPDSANNHYHHHHPQLIDFAEKPSVIDYECGSFGPYPVDELHVGLQPDINGSLDGIKSSPDVERAVLNVRFIAQHMENLDNFTDACLYIDHKVIRHSNWIMKVFKFDPGYMNYNLIVPIPDRWNGGKVLKEEC
ncbi:acetylcholine receptor subunit alpha-like 1 [Trichonephila inaurata madagascariensis]|uniref:Acetylcholine receptor subunit alpha-like 1 n=1 Tax=Trichonephila inaurata madagascariensis TaxID=2747483 RepID=A0A8X6XWR7_9ARAC|nr:acetylcholine receptor subunit alpha-like 1 [Trichonephila inaurata madagascariensis]